MSKFLPAFLILLAAPAWAQPLWLADLRAGGYILYLRHASSHGNPFRALVDAPYLREGEMAIIRPRGDSFAVVARIRVEDWQALE